MSFALQRAVHALMRRVGADLVRYDARTFPHLRRRDELRRLGIGLVLDVGAHEGRWARALREIGFRGRIVSFEPLSSAYAELERRSSADPSWECRRVAIADRDGEAELHVAGNLLSSSLLPIGPRHIESAPSSAEVGTEVVPTARLDSIREELIRGERTYLKLDVQGMELNVLRAARATLRNVDAVEAELSLVELYEGQPLLSDVDAFLRECGFALVHLEPEFRDPRSRAILQLAGIFVRVP